MIIHNPAGCTAVSALITDDNILFIANSGDSRAIISDNGEAVALTIDHKPNSPSKHITSLFYLFLKKLKIFSF